MTDQDDERRAQGEALLDAIRRQAARDRARRDRLNAALAELTNQDNEQE